MHIQCKELDTNVSVCRYVDIFWFFSPAVSAVKADNPSPGRDGSMMIFKYQCSGFTPPQHSPANIPLQLGQSRVRRTVNPNFYILSPGALLHSTLYTLLRQFQSGSKYCSHSQIDNVTNKCISCIDRNWNEHPFGMSLISIKVD